MVQNKAKKTLKSAILCLAPPKTSSTTLSPSIVAAALDLPAGQPEGLNVFGTGLRRTYLLHTLHAGRIVTLTLNT